MPRTKQSTKRSLRENADELDSLLRDFDRQFAQRVAKFEAEINMRQRNIDSLADVALARLPLEVQNMSIGTMLALESPRESDDESAASAPTSPLPTVKGKKRTKRVTAASDDGYATESTTRNTRASRVNSTTSIRQPRNARSVSSSRNSESGTKRGRSSSMARNARPTPAQDRNDLLKPNAASRMSRFKTPSAKNGAAAYGPVTPKVKPNTPMNLLRRPRDGEMVLSMQGSPLLVSSVIQERVANINVPLHNGNVISLLPNAGLRLSSVPTLDAETMQQLKTLRGHIEKVIGSN